LIKGTNHGSFCEKHGETEINQMAFDDEHILVVIINFDREHGKDRVTHGFTQALISALPKSTPWMCARSRRQGHFLVSLVSTGINNDISS
jgi:hypothetical protein